jgi:hypothetical protein
MEKDHLKKAKFDTKKNPHGCCSGNRPQGSPSSLGKAQERSAEARINYEIAKTSNHGTD